MHLNIKSQNVISVFNFSQAFLIRARCSSGWLLRCATMHVLLPCSTPGCWKVCLPKATPMAQQGIWKNSTQQLTPKPANITGLNPPQRNSRTMPHRLLGCVYVMKRQRRNPTIHAICKVTVQTVVSGFPPLSKYIIFPSTACQISRNKEPRFLDLSSNQYQCDKQIVLLYGDDLGSR